VETLWKRDDAIQMVSLDPILKFPWLVAGIGSPLEHGNDDDFHGDRPIFGLKGKADEQAERRSHKTRHTKHVTS
jgi:hypothetical protein